MNINLLSAEIANKLRLDDKATADAHAGRPASDAAAMGGNEKAIMAEARDAGAKEIGMLDKHRQNTDNAIEECRKSLSASRASREQFVATKPPEEGNLQILKRRHENAESAYNQFKADNNLVRDASGDDRVAQFMWAAIIAIAESVLNASFFEPASDKGYFGGFIIAISVGFINVSFAFLGGAAGLRYAHNHCDPMKKLWGLLGFLPCLAISAAMVSLATLYRSSIDALKNDSLDARTIADQASRDALNLLFSFDVGALFGSVESFLLFFAGALCTIIGVWKGYKFDDPYPEFGAMWRQKEEARECYREAEEQHKAAIREWRENDGGKIRAAESVLKEATNKLETEKNAMHLQQNNATEVAEDAAKLASVLLNRYRVKNTDIRADAPPKYFSTEPTREDFSLLIEQYAASRCEAEESAKRANVLLQECRDECDEIRRIWGTA